jgi:hypothetical protein
LKGEVEVPIGAFCNKTYRIDSVDRGGGKVSIPAAAAVHLIGDIQDALVADQTDQRLNERGVTAVEGRPYRNARLACRPCDRRDLLTVSSRGLFYISMESILLEMLSPTFQATSSILLAAFAASRRVGLFRGIIRTATAPAAAPMPAVIAHPLTFMNLPPFLGFGISMPSAKKFTSGRFLSLQPEKSML